MRERHKYENSGQKFISTCNHVRQHWIQNNSVALESPDTQKEKNPTKITMRDKDIKRECERRR